MKNYISVNIQETICGIMKDYGKNRPIDSMNALSEPDKKIINGITDRLFQVVYPGYFKDRTYRYYEIRNHLTITMEDIAYHLSKQVANSLKREQLKERFDEIVLVQSEADELLSDEEIPTWKRFLTAIRLRKTVTRSFCAIRAFMLSQYTGWPMNCIGWKCLCFPVL